MTDNEILELTKAANRNYYIMQAFTYISGIIILIASYLYSHGIFEKYSSYFYYSYFTMGIISLGLGFTFTQKINKSKMFAERVIKLNPESSAKFIKNRYIHGFINAALIVVLILSMTMEGIQLELMNNFFFILIIFSYWFSSFNYYQIFKSYNTK